MKELLILRHAKSSWAEPGMADHERPLNARGLRDAPRIGQLLRTEGIVPEAILSSTAVRARSTARLVADESGFAGEVALRPALYHAPPHRYREALAELPDSVTRAMVVGHNPGLEDLLEQLTGSGETLPTAALAHIALPIDGWTELSHRTPGRLLALWKPRELE